MKQILYILSLLTLTIGCSNNINSQKNVKLSKDYSKNLEFLITILERDIPNYFNSFAIDSKSFRKDSIDSFFSKPLEGFYINKDKERIIGATIYNLNTGNKNSVNFKNNHVYHIAPMEIRDSFNYILCVFNNKMYLFESINCNSKGDNLVDVLTFLKPYVSKKLINEETIERVENYREYGDYIRIDAMSHIRCDREP